MKGQIEVGPGVKQIRIDITQVIFILVALALGLVNLF